MMNNNHNRLPTSSSNTAKKRPRSSSFSAQHHQQQQHQHHHQLAVTFLLYCLIAFTTSTTQAFVVASDRPSSSPNLNKSDKLFKQQQQQQHLHQAGVVSHLDTGLYSTVAVPLHQWHQKQNQLLQEEEEELLQFFNDQEPVVVPEATAATTTTADHAHHKNVLDHTKKNALEVDLSSTIKAAKIDEDDVLEWASRFTSVEALREHFGTNQNKLWGDLQASTARRLYKTLLPRALLELSKVQAQLKPEDLAPLAYQARLAAKLYARERCTVPARIAATLFDGFRQWMKYGKFQGHGMTYDQLWEKYAEKVLKETEEEHPHSDSEEEEEEEMTDNDECLLENDDDVHRHYHVDEEISEQVCRKIIERACVSNEGVDSFVGLKKKKNHPVLVDGDHGDENDDYLDDDTTIQPNQRHLLEKIKSQLEQDMYQLLVPGERHKHQLSKRQEQQKTKKYRLAKKAVQKRKFWHLDLVLPRHRRRRTIEEHLQQKTHKPWMTRGHSTTTTEDDGSDNEYDGLHP